MTAFPEGIETPADAIRLLISLDGRQSLELGEWELDEFASVPHPLPAVERCRLRVRDELIDLLTANDEARRSGISPLVDQLVAELEAETENDQAQVMTKKTLTVRAAGADEAPAIKKKGRGWEISEKRLDALHERAREMRRNPTPAQEALAAALAEVETGGYSFKRQDVIGSAIVDFACKPLMLVVELDGDEDASFTADRARSLTEIGYRVERLSAGAVLADPDAAAAQVSAVMRERWHERRAARATRPAQNRAPSNRHSGRRPQD